MEPTGFWDYPDSQLSIMNMATLRECSTVLGQPLNMDRFRGNLIVDGLPPWAEFGLAGWHYLVGEAEIEFTRPVRRCAATQVNPETGERDIPVNTLLADTFEHGYFGIYARVCKTGTIRRGDKFVRLGATETKPSDAIVEGAGPPQLWPKLAAVEIVSSNPRRLGLKLQPVGTWPLSDAQASGDMKLHIGAHNTRRASILRCSRECVSVEVQFDENASLNDFSTQPTVVVTGPYRRAAD